MHVDYTLGDVLLRIENVSLSYGDKPVLLNVSGQIRDILVPGRVTGQVYGLLGPSGMGKTQLFRIIAGLNKPTSGRASVNGFDRPVHAGEVGVVAQSYPLFEHRTVFSNLMLAARQKEKDYKTAKEKVENLLAEFDLTERQNLYPAHLSGGQRQRAAIIQQILCSEHFLLMDEPFSGLDLIMLEKTIDLIRKVADMDELNTIIVVTHDVTAAAAVSDHLWLLGRDTATDGSKIPGAKIVREFNLIERDLCYERGIITKPVFTDFVRDVKEEFRKL
jgi:ABC-type nitrate/sulfonate/bicarbonate transport system ATPase subunit